MLIMSYIIGKFLVKYKKLDEAYLLYDALILHHD